MGFIVAFFLVVWLALICLTVFYAIESERTWVLVVPFTLVVLGFGGLFQGAINEKRKGPCVKSEVQMHFNAATKTMMPAKVCVNRGEWIDKD